MTEHFFPPLLDLSPDEIRTRKQHLLREIAGGPQRARLPRTRIIGIVAAAGAAAAIAAIAVALVPASPGRSRSPFTPAAAKPTLAPFYSFHASVTSYSADHRDYSQIGDHVIPSLDALAASRKDIPRAVLALAAAQARSYGNRRQVRVQWLKTTRQTAVSAENAGRVDGGSLPVYFVILHGHFVDNSAPRPHGATSPRGRIVTDTIEIKTGRTLDFGIGNGEPKFSKTGKPHDFVIYGHRRSR
jgi:hypothetical protein